MNKKEDKLNKILADFKEEQRKFNEKQLLFNKKVEAQNKKNKRFVIYILIFSVLFSGIASVASYTFGASSVAYTPTDNSWQVANTQEAIDDLFDSVGSALVGSVYSYMGTSAPHGYLECDGSIYKISDYPRLAGHINGHFGSYNFFGGDGVTTFAVPDLRGEFLRGTGTNSRTNQGSGSAVGTHQDATGQLRIRTDTTNMWVSGRNDAEYKQTNTDSEYGTSNKLYGGASYWGGTMIEKQYFTARPTNTSVLYIIKY